jgi:hypothetical protein
MITSIEQALETKYRKFQPYRDGSRISGPSRVYLEYDGETGDYIERDPRSGDVVECGVIERPERDVPVRTAA